jgi:toxin ParE1/3/4
MHRHATARFGDHHADRYPADPGRVFDAIAAFPEIGRACEGARRQFVHGRRMILYRMQGGEVVIGRVFHAAQRR